MAIDSVDMLVLKDFHNVSIEERKRVVREKLADDGVISGVIINAPSMLYSDIDDYRQIFSNPHFLVTDVDWINLKASIKWVVEPFDLDRCYLSMASLMDIKEKDSKIKNLFGFYLSPKDLNDYAPTGYTKKEDYRYLPDDEELKMRG